MFRKLYPCSLFIQTGVSLAFYLSLYCSVFVSWCLIQEHRNELKTFHCLRSQAVNKTFLLAQLEANVGGSGVGVQMLRGQVVLG